MYTRAEFNRESFTAYECSCSILIRTGEIHYYETIGVICTHMIDFCRSLSHILATVCMHGYYTLQYCSSYVCMTLIIAS